jgi:hypothetical protein
MTKVLRAVGRISGHNLWRPARRRIAHLKIYRRRILKTGCPLAGGEQANQAFPADSTKIISFALEYLKNITLDDYFVFRRKVLPESKVAS